MSSTDDPSASTPAAATADSQSEAKKVDPFSAARDAFDSVVGAVVGGGGNGDADATEEKEAGEGERVKEEEEGEEGEGTPKPKSTGTETGESEMKQAKENEKAEESQKSTLAPTPPKSSTDDQENSQISTPKPAAHSITPLPETETIPPNVPTTAESNTNIMIFNVHTPTHSFALPYRSEWRV